MATIYNKLVRDRIPEIIKNAGKIAEYEVLSQADYAKMLEKKLDEETAEFHSSKDVEELADILEVLYAIGKTKGVSPEQLDKIRAEKAKKRGKFDECFFLKSVYEQFDANKIGTFFSWTILDMNNAEKECDKSFFEYRTTGIPQEIRWFFDAENIEEQFSVNLFYKNKRYDAVIDLARNRTRLSWKTDLGDQMYRFQRYKKTIAHFKKINETDYELTMCIAEE